MRELKIVIPAIIDYCRYSNSNLGTNRHYFFWTPESKKINLVTKPVFSNDDINSLLADLDVCFSIEDVVSGRFIDSFMMNNSELQEKQLSTWKMTNGLRSNLSLLFLVLLLNDCTISNNMI